MDRRCRPDTRAYSRLRNWSSASLRWRRTWNFVERETGQGSVPRGGQAKGFPHVHDDEPEARCLAQAEPGPGVELVRARLRAIPAAKPDRALPDQVPDDDAVGVVFLDRDLVEPDHLRSGRSGPRQLLAQVLLLHRLHGVPIEPQLLRYIPDGRGATAPAHVEGKALWRRRDCPPGRRAAPASQCHSADRPRAGPRPRGRSTGHRRRDPGYGVVCGRTIHSAPGRRPAGLFLTAE